MSTSAGGLLPTQAAAWACLDVDPDRYAHAEWLPERVSVSSPRAHEAVLLSLRHSLQLPPLTALHATEVGARALLLAPESFGTLQVALCAVSGMPTGLLAAASSALSHAVAHDEVMGKLTEALCERPVPWRPLLCALDVAVDGQFRDVQDSLHAQAWLEHVQARLWASAFMLSPALIARWRVRLPRAASAHAAGQPWVDRHACSSWWSHVDAVLLRFAAELKILA